MKIKYETTLRCGRSRPSGKVVTDKEVDAFIREVVTPLFPAGFSYRSGRGQWRDEKSGKIIRESTLVMKFAHGGSIATQRAIHDIAQAYKRCFGQDAVLRVNTQLSSGRFV